MIIDTLIPSGFLFKGIGMFAVAMYIIYKLIDKTRTYKGE